MKITTIKRTPRVANPLSSSKTPLLALNRHFRRNQPELAQKVVTQLILLQSISDEPIRIYLNSRGGHVEAGDTIHDFIKFIRPDVHIIGTGWVASAGITIFLAAKKSTATRCRTPAL